jgi:glutathione S-transferase
VRGEHEAGDHWIDALVLYAGRADGGAPEIYAIHPFGKMPVMRHGDVELFESKAIATYLDRGFPGPSLFPSEPLPAALTEQWVSLVNTLVDRTLIRTYLLAYAAPGTADGKPDRQAIDAVTPALRRQFEVLDKAVARTGHLVGREFTFADINLMPILYYMRLVPEGAEALSRATHLAVYYERHAERPSFKNTIPPAGPPRRMPAS